MRWIVTGSGGQLGRCLVSAIERHPEDELVRAFDHQGLDLADEDSLARAFEAEADVLVNAAAFTAVDRCETEADRAFAVNAVAPGRLAVGAKRAGLGFVHVSTDYVFAGDGDHPYQESAPIAPRTEYGRGKAEGERRVLDAHPAAIVARTSWVFGPGRNFVGAILDQAAKRRAQEVEGPLRVVSDQRGTPTYAQDLADGLLELGRRAYADAAGRDEPSPDRGHGLVHLTNTGDTTWWEFARAILAETGFGDLAVEAIRTEDLDLPAPRPRYSVLDCSRAASLGVRLRSWREALVAYLQSAAGRALQGVAS